MRPKSWICGIFGIGFVDATEPFKLLVQSYTRARYDADYKINIEQLEYLIPKVEKLKGVTEEICKKIIS